MVQTVSKCQIASAAKKELPYSCVCSSDVVVAITVADRNLYPLATTAIMMMISRTPVTMPATDTAHDALPSLRPHCGSDTTVLLATAAHK